MIGIISRYFSAPFLVSIILLFQHKPALGANYTPEAIYDFATKDCHLVTQSGAVEGNKVKANIAVQIKGLISSFFGGEVGASAESYQDKYTGLRQQDLIDAIKAEATCKEYIWRDMHSLPVIEPIKDNFKILNYQHPKGVLNFYVVGERISEDDCQFHCLNHRDCVAFVFKRDDRACYLKTGKITGWEFWEQGYSGAKLSYSPRVNFEIREKQHPNPKSTETFFVNGTVMQAGDCQVRCADSPDCVAYFYSDANGCYLKKGEIKAGWVSAPEKAFTGLKVSTTSR
jgi:hypothetical protein